MNKFMFCLFVMACVGEGCGTSMPRNAVPENLVNDTEILGIKNVRSSSGTAPRDMTEALDAWYEEQRDARIIRKDGKESPDANFLALSCGGENGAFGAGLLAGWTSTGTRPEFLEVTGVSTGGLSAPFIFLGPKYDETLKKLYTDTQTKDIATKKSWLNALGGPSLMDTTPLKKILERIIDENFLAEIATEYRRGRRLYIATTNLDTGQGVVWNMGAIAASSRPEALDLFREVMRASAAVPAAFPPVLIHVNADGKQFDEMHVDGGVSAQVFFLPVKFGFKDVEEKHHVIRDRHLYVIRNGKFNSDWKRTEGRLGHIAARSIDLLINNQGVGDVIRIKYVAEHNGVDFNLASIPESYPNTSKELFDETFMRGLYDYAYNRAQKGDEWGDLRSLMP
jgi:predicted patatin/cPLA2 family phospholipase